ncbi:MAG: hypothetical protein LC733_12815 [Actinobacteria bacterium]|nr:hypothetical protein [Actinomycetota bacterium]
MTAGLRRAGVGLALLYVAVAVATQLLSSRPFRPLFNGFAPPQPYRRDVVLGPEGSEVTNVTTSDDQAVAGLELGSVPPNPPDTGVKLQVAPVDPGRLAPLPQGLDALSNAYQVTLTYLPSQTAVLRLAKDGTIALTAVSPHGILLYSADGAEWAEVPSRPFGNTNGRFTTLQATGHYLVAGTRVPPPAEPDESAPSGPNTALLTIVGLLPIIGAMLVLRPPPPAPAPPVPAKRNPRAGPKPKRGKRPRSGP